MKKIVSYILIVLSILAVLSALAGCDNKIYHWEFAQSYPDVKELKIIEAKDEYTYEVVKNLDVHFVEELYGDIENLDAKRYGTNLRHPYGKCFLIVFNNGEYDIISKIEPKHIRYKDDKLRVHSSWLKYDSEQFDELINKYLNS